MGTITTNRDCQITLANIIQLTHWHADKDAPRGSAEHNSYCAMQHAWEMLENMGVITDKTHFDDSPDKLLSGLSWVK